MPWWYREHGRVCDWSTWTVYSNSMNIPPRPAYRKIRARPHPSHYCIFACILVRIGRGEGGPGRVGCDWNWETSYLFVSSVDSPIAVMGLNNGDRSGLL